MKCYYAHPIHSYGMKQEKEDIAFLRSLGLLVVNPAKLAKFVEPMESWERMNYFYGLVTKCDCLAYRSFSSGDIGAGVAKEICAMRDKGGFVFELDPTGRRRLLNIEETRDYLERLSNPV